MSEPQIQIVTEQDVPLKAANKRDVYTNGWYHRMSRVMVEDGKGRILLQQRAKDMEMYPWRWDNSAAGYVDAGEDYLAAAQRELNEEIGLSDARLEPLGYYESRAMFGWRQLNRFNQVYKLTVDQDTKFDLKADEVASVEWFTLYEAKRLVAEHPELCTDGLIEVLTRFYK